MKCNTVSTALASAFRLSFCLFSILILSSCQPDQDKRAIVIGIDGVQWERLQALHTPNFDRLQFTKAYAGGIANSAKEQVTASGSGWSTLLTGVWADKHKIVKNLQFGIQARYLTFLARAKADQPALRTAAIVNWGNPYTLYYTFEIPLMKQFRYYPNNDTKVTRTVVDSITNNQADVLFVHLDKPDHAGHAYGFGPEYDQSILSVDQYLGEILDAIEQRQATHPDEDWLVMTVTDHGREPETGQDHGKQTTSEKTVYIGINDVGVNEEFTRPTTQLPYDEFEGLYSYPAQTAVAVTVLRHLNVGKGQFIDLEGTPLIGPLGVRKLHGSLDAENTAANLSWVNSQSASRYTTITRNGSVIAELDNNDTQDLQTYRDDLTNVQEKQLDYVVTTNGVDSYFRLYR